MIQGVSSQAPTPLGNAATQETTKAGANAVARGTPAAPSFQDMLTDLLQDVDRAQKQADNSIEKLAAGKPVSVQDVVLRLEEADLAFRMMKEIRDKLVQAYKEVMSTQV
jgi:flagellar hook-basal body complex protein FliE